MSREKLIEAMRVAIDAATVPSGIGLVDFSRAQAEAALSVLNPLLERVGYALEPLAILNGFRRDDAADDDPVMVDYCVIRRGASLHTELKGLLP